MKRFFILLLLIAAIPAIGQQYNNEWINFNQTYYKFKVGSKGLYRIPKSTLDAAGIGNTSVQFFELWRNGERVRLHPSTSSGPLGSNGFLEFWGEGNDGKPDKALYRVATYQHTTQNSLLTDTASYFLSVNTDQSGLFYTDPGNDDNAKPVEPYFIYTAGNYYRNTINPGFANVVGEYVYSSSFDKGEFWSSDYLRPGTPLVTNMADLQPYSGGPSPSIKFGAMGDAFNSRSVRVSVGGTQVTDASLDFFTDINTSVNFSAALISSGSADVRFENTSSTGSDRMLVSYFELTYPRKFSFNNQENFAFSLPQSSTGYHLEITEFDYGSTAPVLYDLTNGDMIKGDISVPGKVTIFIQPGLARNFVLVSQEAGNLHFIGGLTQKKFKLFTTTGNQGDYLIITNKVLFTGSHSNNPINDYAAYRSSSAGGGFAVQIVDIDELVDQFGLGIKKNPIAIKNFLRYARDKFSVAPKFAFLIGRAVTYNEQRANESDPVVDQLNLVPTFGFPASDNMLSSNDNLSPIAVTPIGRLAVVRGSEVEDYLEKLKDYENVQQTSPNTIAARQWMKNVIHVTGASDPYLGTVLCNYMSVYKQVIQDTVFGGNVASFCKASTSTGEQMNNQKIADLLHQGASILTYFGHSSSTTLEFNLDNPESYQNQGKYPVFLVNGCNAGNFYGFNAPRLLVNESLSEKFTLAKERGAIAFVASTHFGLVNYLNIYLNNLYGLIAKTDVGKPIGVSIRDALSKLIAINVPGDFGARSHAEEINLHGDPALKINGEAKPDYVIEDPQVIINPSFISIAEESFHVKARIYNLGRSVADSIIVEVKRQYPDGSIETVVRKKMRGIQYADSLLLDLPIVATRDKGSNKIIITVDADAQIDEISEDNNTVTKEAFIFEDEARAVFPYNYAIINKPNQKLYASTANPFSASRSYLMEMDTTELFNSSFKISKTISSIGGILEFDPAISYVDKRVYYWRVTPVTPNSANYAWSTSSFIYINGNDEGFNQSHYYQHKNSSTERLSYTDAGKWAYGSRANHLFIRNGVYPYAGTGDSDFSIDIDGNMPIASACVGKSLIFNVFDSITFRPWKNVDASGNNLFLSGSGSANCAPSRNYNFEFSYMDSISRKNMINFMDSIPNGNFVVVRTIPDADSASNVYVDTWKKDTALNGSYNSLYHRLLAAGFTAIDSFYRPRVFTFVYKKGNPDFTPKFGVSQGIFDRLTTSVECLTPDTIGFITSPVFGPAETWKKVIWSGSSLETGSADNPIVSVIGITNNDVETTLFTLDKTQQNFDISSVSASQYPRMKLKMRNVDSVTLTPYQLKDWKIYYTPIPEGSLAANIFLQAKDTVELGEPYDFGIAFKNISSYPMDSLSLKMTLLDNNNVTHTIALPKRKPLIVGDTIIFRYQFDSRDYPEANTLFVEFNPNNDQPEQYHFNNFLYKTFYVKTDQVNPMLDVTFDGVHILNRDLVSAKPHIQIKIKDDAHYLLLNDTALQTVQVRYPDGTVRTHRFDNDTLRFTPATSSVDNSATVDFYPYFSKQYSSDGDEYELIVQGKDRSGNKAGTADYRIAFTIINKPMISNLLNYPNPFSTSTAFVFTLTGSEVPQNMKIQILTVTGKIVREITSQELGPIHIGRNITDFKWDGNDQFGQKLGNGVYLYRFVTSLNGKRMEKYRAKGDNTDMFFNNGYGKMYLMR